MGEVSYEKTADDFVAMYRDVFQATIRHRPVRRAARIGAAVAMLALLAWLLDREGSGFAAMFYGAAVGVAIAVPVCWGIAWLLLPRRARKLYAQDRTTDPRWTWRWSEDELVRRSANAHVLYVPRRQLTEAQATELRVLADAAGVRRR